MGRSDDVFIFMLWSSPLTFDFQRLYSTSDVTWSNSVPNLTENRTIRGEIIDDLAHLRSRQVTLWPWPLTSWSWTFVVDRMSCKQTLYQICAKSNNLRLRYWSFSKFSCVFAPPAPMGRCNVWVVVPSLAEDVNSGILFTRDRCTSWEIQHIFSTQILRERQNHLSLSKMGTDLHQILGEHTSLIDAPTCYLRCQLRWIILELECFIQN